MRKKLLILFTLIFFISGIAIYAEDTAQDQQKNDLQNKINEYEKKLDSVRQEKNSLSSQIQYMDTQISLATLRIQDSEQKVISTQKEITLLNSRINGLDNSLDFLSQTLLKRVVNGYKHRSLSFMDMLFDSDNASEAINKIKYQKTTQENNEKLLVQVQNAKLNFEEQKSLREQKTIELENLQKKLTAQKAELDTQKTQKQLLLKDTQNDEKKYQQLLAAAVAEFNAVQKAVASGAKVGPVKKGDPIALVGNSGAPYCSTGAHLHFEVRQNGTWTNPENFVASHSVQDNQESVTHNMGSGSWDWPLNDQIVVEQHYGKTPWSYRYAYSGGIHTGIDMWSKSSEVIHAPADGTLYSSAQDCSGATINIKYIDHGNGLMTFYLHVQ